MFGSFHEEERERESKAKLEEEGERATARKEIKKKWRLLPAPSFLALRSLHSLPPHFKAALGGEVVSREELRSGHDNRMKTLSNCC